MRRLKQPDLWLLATLLLVTAGGAVLLAQADATQPQARHLSYSRHHWQAAFDALSATCGVGLLTYGFQDDYTARGRWILTALGVLGALSFVAAVTHAARRMQPADGRPILPHPLFVVSAFLVAQALALGACLLAERIGGDTGGSNESAWRTIAAFSSLGWASEVGVDRLKTGPPGWPLALLAWLGALGWPVWLLIVPPLARRYVRIRSALAVFGSYTGALLLTALLISAFESPRGGAYDPGSAKLRFAPSTNRQSEIPNARSAIHSPQPNQPRPPVENRCHSYVRSLVQTAAASGAGIPTMQSGASHYPLGDATAGTKVTLSALLLVGGLGGSATGGVQWLLLLWALAGGAVALGCPRESKPNPNVKRWMLAGLACLVLLTLLALLVAAGMLLIENWTAARYQPPPTFADALLDACSVVAGGNLSSGLTETVTGRNLLGGIRQSANLYQYGMTWLMLAMLIGRLLPLVVLRRLADAQSESD